MVLWSQEWRVYSTQQTSLVARSLCVMVDIEQAIQTCETEHLHKIRFNLSMHWNFCFPNSEWKFRYQSSQSGSCTLLMTSLLLSRAGWHRFSEKGIKKTLWCRSRAPAQIGLETNLIGEPLYFGKGGAMFGKLWSFYFNEYIFVVYPFRKCIPCWVLRQTSDRKAAPRNDGHLGCTETLKA